MWKKKNASSSFKFKLQAMLYPSLQYSMPDPGARVVGGGAAGEVLEAADRKRTGR